MTMPMNEAVVQYIFYVSACARTPNWNIVDVVTEDYRTDLTPQQRLLAEFEVDVMRFVSSPAEHDRTLALVNMCKELYVGVATLESSSQEEAVTQAQEAAAAAASAAEAAQANAAAAVEAGADAAAAASDAATSAAEAAEAANAADEEAAEANEAATAAAELAQQAQESVEPLAQTMARGVRVGIRALDLPAFSVAQGPNAKTLVPLPSNAIRSAPFTRRPSSWSISNGVLRVAEAGLYSYDFSVVFATGLVSAGAFRFYMAVGQHLASNPVIHDDSLFVAQVALLTAPTGLCASGELVVPAGGADVAIYAGHTALLAPATLALAKVELSLKRIDLDYDAPT